MTAANSVDDFVLRYPFSSRLSSSANEPKLELATAQSSSVPPHMFEGRLLKPRIAASLLNMLPKLAITRFHTPPNMLAQILALADPVITCSRDIIRLESFSACGSAYARMDVASDACDGDFLGKGTTNVDFQQSLRDALAAITADCELGLGIGKSEVELSVDEQEFVERKVQLPVRWLRGFAEVAAYQANMVLVHSVAKVAATRFLQGLPGDAGEKADYYVLLRRGELSLSQQKQADAVKVAGLARLKALKSLAPYLDGLSIYADESGRASSWLFKVGPYTFEFVISATAYRGFSGEGQLLYDLASDETERFLPQVRAALNWQTKIEKSQLATQCGTNLDTIKSCLSKLASSGLVGYDCSTGDYFHRELPFKPSRTVVLNPRLRGAKKIIEDNVIEVTDASADFVQARVAGSGVTHIVSGNNDSWTCTCVWHAKHQGERGPCKHILSVRMLMESGDGN